MTERPSFYSLMNYYVLGELIRPVLFEISVDLVLADVLIIFNAHHFK